MASAMYLKGRVEIGNGNVDYLADTIKVLLLDSTYVPDLTGDNFYSDVSASEIVGTGYTAGGQALANKAVNTDTPNNRAEFDADDITVWSTADFTGARYAVVYKDTGVAATSQLICLLDLLVATDAPFTLVFDSDGLFSWGAC